MRTVIKENSDKVIYPSNFNSSSIYVAFTESSGFIFKLVSRRDEGFYWSNIFLTNTNESCYKSGEEALESMLSLNAFTVYEFDDVLEFAEWLFETVRKLRRE